jgi:SnoaL-like domain
MTLDEVIAREGIRQTITNYTIAADKRDAALFNALWTEDAIFEFAGFPPVGGFKCEGLDAIRNWTAAWGKLRNVDDPTLRSASFARHNLTTCHIELTGTGVATARTFFIVVTDIGPDHAGTYSDILVRQSERWLFSHRRIALDWRSPDSIYPAVKRQ